MVIVPSCQKLSSGCYEKTIGPARSEVPAIRERPQTWLRVARRGERQGVCVAGLLAYVAEDIGNKINS